MSAANAEPAAAMPAMATALTICKYFKPAPIISEWQHIVLALRMLSQFGNIWIKTQPQGDGIRHPKSSTRDHQRDRKRGRRRQANGISDEIPLRQVQTAEVDLG
jgi:hypothetical protein